MSGRGDACVSSLSPDAGVCSREVQVRASLSITTAGIRMSIDRIPSGQLPQAEGQVFMGMPEEGGILNQTRPPRAASRAVWGDSGQHWH